MKFSEDQISYLCLLAAVVAGRISPEMFPFLVASNDGETCHWPSHLVLQEDGQLSIRIFEDVKVGELKLFEWNGDHCITYEEIYEGLHWVFAEAEAQHASANGGECA